MRCGMGGSQRSEIRRQKSGVKLISDLRLLTSLIDDFYGLLLTVHRLPFTNNLIDESTNFPIGKC